MSSQPKVKLGTSERAITWDNGALYRADLLGLPKRLAAGKLGYATLCQMIWVMLGAQDRAELPEPEDVAKYVGKGDVADLWAKVLAAYATGNGSGDSEAKNGTGGSGLSPASS